MQLLLSVEVGYARALNVAAINNKIAENAEDGDYARKAKQNASRLRHTANIGLNVTFPEAVRPTMRRARKATPDPSGFLARAVLAKATVECQTDQIIYTQGDAANCLFYLRKGGVKLSVVSKQGKEAVIALLGAGDFFGEGCVTGQPLRMATARAISPCSLVRIGRTKIASLLRRDPGFSDYFMSYLISHISKVEEDLVDQLFNSSEKRLARALLLLAQYGKEGRPETVIPPVNQETLAEMIGTTRSRVNVFMNKFRKLGFIDYNGGLKVHSSLLNVVLHD